MKLFGTDGVRGKAGEKINAIDIMKLAMATGIYFRKFAKTNRILVGKDTRRSGYMVENALVSGLTAVGFDVIQIGPMPTPAIAFLTENMRCDAGIMISASHNPYYDNGVKFFDCTGNKLNREKEKAIEDIFSNDTIIKEAQATEKNIGKSKRIDDVIGRYIVHIKNSFPKQFSLSGKKIVVDCANGAAYKVAPTILQELGAEVISLGTNPDGFNINENCGAMHPNYAAKAVVDYHADIGIALDGDADRIVIIDEKGDIVDGDKLIAVLAVHLKSQKSLANNAIVATVMSNYGLEEYLAGHDIKVHRSAVGDKHVVEMMQSNKLNFGGEQSGHIIFSDYAKTGDGLSSALQALAFLVKNQIPASQAFNPYVSYPQKLVNLPINKKPDISTLNGIKDLENKISQQNIRHLFRYSGTENKIRLLLEGKNEAELNDTMKLCENFFKEALA